MIKSQSKAWYMYLQIDPLENSLRTHPIQMGREITIEPYPNQQFGFINDPDCQFGTSSVPTGTRTQSDCPEPLLTPAGAVVNHSKIHLALQLTYFPGSIYNYTESSITSRAVLHSTHPSYTSSRQIYLSLNRGHTESTSSAYTMQHHVHSL